MNTNKFTTYINHHNEFLYKLLINSTIPASQIKEAMLYVLFPGGKRLRPLLVYLCGEIVSIPKSNLDFIAAAIELTHCYSLVHDDLPAMDNDNMRRGRPSCHRAFDEATAILVGDGLQALAVEILVTGLSTLLAPTIVLDVISKLVHASGPSGLISGQQMDLTALNSKTIEPKELYLIHHLKTGRLIRACIEMVLAINCPSAVIYQALINFANNLGMVYQMQDDYLARYANPEFLGKNQHSDEINQKLTFASIYSQKQLLSLIEDYFAKARAALTTKEVAADGLIELSYFIQNLASVQRSNR